MNADTDKLALALAALPCKSPSAGFRARVLAALEREAAAARMGWKVLAGAGALCAGWAVLLALGATWLAVANMETIAGVLSSPGELWAQAKYAGYLAFRAAAGAARYTALLLAAADLGGTAKAALPGAGAAALIAAALTYGLAGGARSKA